MKNIPDSELHLIETKTLLFPRTYLGRCHPHSPRLLPQSSEGSLRCSAAEPPQGPCRERGGAGAACLEGRGRRLQRRWWLWSLAQRRGSAAAAACTGGSAAPAVGAPAPLAAISTPTLVNS